MTAPYDESFPHPDSPDGRAWRERCAAAGQDDPYELPLPRGYVGVEHDDGTVHAIDLDDLHDDRPLWREPPVCGRATGVSSDEGGPAALHRRVITCLDCTAILA
jgi:hypothetical protein